MNKFFDIDLPFGQSFEKKLAEILIGNGKLEVKTERDIWKRTGNICIELEYKGEPSGLNITEADHWAHVLQENGELRLIFIFPTHVLRRFVKECESKRLEYGGDNKDTLNALIPISDLLDYTRYIHDEM